MDVRPLLLLVTCITLFPSSRGVLRKSRECDNTLGCIINPELTVMLTWQPDQDRVHFQLRAYIGAGDLYVAMGLSHDDRMGSDSVNECVHSGGIVTVHASYNTGKSNRRYVDAGLLNKTGQYENGTIMCSFTRVTNASTDGKRHSLLLPWHVLLVWGHVAQGSDEKMQHQVVSASSQKVDLQAVGSYETEKFSNMLVKLHGCAMVLAWVLLTSVGIIMARYFKGLLPESSVCGVKIWFQVHRTVMVFVLLLTVAGLTVIFIEVGGYRLPSKDSDILQVLHPIFGIIVTALCLLNPIIALFRPHPDAARRPIFNWVHRTIGTSCHLLAAVTLFFGLMLKKAAAPRHMLLILGGFFLWHLVVEVIFFLQVFAPSKKSKRRKFEVSTIDQEGKQQEQPKIQKITGVQEVLLMMHCAVAMATTILLMALFLT